jgi:hypothetical protein
MASTGPVYAEQETLLKGVIRESGWYGGPAVRFGGINNSLAVFAGYRGGWIINRTLSIGGGGYGLVSDVYFSGSKLKLGYGGLDLEYKIDPDEIVHLTFRSLIGLGMVELTGVGQDSFFVLEPGVGVDLNVVRFLKVNGGVSYRLVSGAGNVPGVSDSSLSGLTAEIALIFGFSGVTGSGRKISETRDLPPFHSLVLRGHGKIRLSQGESQKVTIRADDNIADKLRTEVSDGRLVISADKWIMDESDAVFDITVTDIREISLSGVGELESRETIRAKDLKIRLSGTGEISLDLEAENVMTKISGTGEIRLKGHAEEHSIKISGAGELRGYDFTVGNTRVDISGAGECNINVIDTLYVDISGAGSVRYQGEPEVTVEHLSVAGSLRKKD